ncbi:hypothetical protein [Acinetobacter amyesii]|uniref:hypothetical protein n=1 Tax=Acinetobacter amyesii TaxID=2942470 RepID=UPI0020C03358|nr:hypothetical protein [Acinetobacter amyesii]MCL6241767.1 hypothetical protein [Acinetobacter amyesii]
MKLKNITLILLTLCSSNIFAEVSFTKLTNIKLVDENAYRTNSEVQSDIEDLIQAKKFKEISTNANQLLNSEEYNFDGKFKHTSYLDSFLRIVNKHRVTSSNYYKENIAQGQKWIKAEPESPLGYIYYAMWVRQQAWSVRGGSYSSQVSQNNMQYFADKSMQNLNFLMENYDVASKDPFYYYILLMTLRDLGFEENYLRAYQDGIVKYPKQRVIYNTFMESFEKKWFGENYDAIQMIINDIQEMNPAEKDFHYYHILYTVHNNKYDLKKLNVNWARVEQGAVDSLSKLTSLSKINDVQKLYCSYPGNRVRLERLLKSFKQGQLEKSYIENSLNNCQK